MSAGRRLIFAASLLLAGLVEPASAHTPLRGVGTFYAYVLHPVLVPSHLLTLTASGLLMSQQPRGVGRAAVAVLMGAFVVGLALAASLGVDALPEWRLLGVALVVGALVASGWRQPLSAVLISGAAAGLATGLDSGPDRPLAAASAPAYAGLLFGVSWIVMMLQGYAGEYDQGWPVVAKRVVGSWVVAISLLALTLALRSPAGFDHAAKIVQK